MERSRTVAMTSISFLDFAATVYTLGQDASEILSDPDTGIAIIDPDNDDYTAFFNFLQKEGGDQND